MVTKPLPSYGLDVVVVTAIAIGKFHIVMRRITVGSRIRVALVSAISAAGAMEKNPAIHFNSKQTRSSSPSLLQLFHRSFSVIEYLILWLAVSCSDRVSMMEHIRVRVEILPWSNRTELLRDEVKPRQDAFRPYLEPCTQDVTINELAERIGNRFEKLQRR